MGAIRPARHGDETGDPGPYRYTTLSSHNLEKIGPCAHADTGYAAARWNLDLGAHITSLHTTDSILQSRFPGFSALLPQDVMTVTPSLRAEVRAFGRHELLARYGEQRGLLLVPTTTREQSVRSHATSIGIGGSLDSIAGVVVGSDASILGREPRDERARFSSGAVTSQRQLGATLALAANARVDRVDDWRLAPAPILPGTALPDSSRLMAASGTFAVGGVRLESVGAGMWQGVLAYERMTMAIGDARLRDRARSTPLDELRAQLAATSVRDFRATFTADLTNGTFWPGFGPDSATLRVPAITRIDTSAETWMWSRRLRIGLLFQNLLNRPERHHPCGAQWNPRWHLIGSLVLPPW